MIRTYNYRLFTNAEEDSALDRLLWQSRNVYNAALAQRKDAWEAEKRGVTYAQQWAHFRDERNANPDTLGVLNATSMQQLLRRLDKTFGAFYRRCKRGDTPGYPRFKGRSRFKSIEYRHGDGCKLRFDKQGRALFYVQNVGEVKVKYHRPVPEGAIIKHVVIKRVLDKWFVSLMLELPDAEPVNVPTDCVGIDVGLTALLALSDGELVENPRWLRRSLAKLRRAQRRMARRTKGSGGWQKAGYQVAKLHNHVANQRRDFWHKKTTELVSRYGLIAIEDLTLAFMTQHPHLAKSAHDAALGMFRMMLEQKAEYAAVRVAAVNPWGTSQQCSGCGATVKKDLSVRVHRCTCGLVLNRDVNAARNILQRTLGELGHGLMPWGANVAVVDASVAPEAALL